MGLVTEITEITPSLQQIFWNFQKTCLKKGVKSVISVTGKTGRCADRLALLGWLYLVLNETFWNLQEHGLRLLGVLRWCCQRGGLRGSIYLGDIADDQTQARPAGRM